MVGVLTKDVDGVRKALAEIDGRDWEIDHGTPFWKAGA